jgi:hypothetical protein
MAGTITATTIQNDTSSPPTFRNNSVEIGTLCRAWVNFNGTGTPAIRSSFNVSSITDDGTGLYTINFTTALPNNNYCGIASTRRNNGSAGENNVNNGVTFRGASAYSTAFTTTAVQINVGIVTNEGAYDSDYVAVAIFSS